MPSSNIIKYWNLISTCLMFVLTSKQRLISLAPWINSWVYKTHSVTKATQELTTKAITPSLNKLFTHKYSLSVFEILRLTLERKRWGCLYTWFIPIRSKQWKKYRPTGKPVDCYSMVYTYKHYSEWQIISRAAVVSAKCLKAFIVSVSVYKTVRGNYRYLLSLDYACTLFAFLTRWGGSRKFGRDKKRDVGLWLDRGRWRKKKEDKSMTKAGTCLQTHSCVSIKTHKIHIIHM